MTTSCGWSSTDDIIPLRNKLVLHVPTGIIGKRASRRAIQAIHPKESTPWRAAVQALPNKFTVIRRVNRLYQKLGQQQLGNFAKVDATQSLTDLFDTQHLYVCRSCKKVCFTACNVHTRPERQTKFLRGHFKNTDCSRDDLVSSCGLIIYTMSAQFIIFRESAYTREWLENNSKKLKAKGGRHSNDESNQTQEPSSMDFNNLESTDQDSDSDNHIVIDISDSDDSDQEEHYYDVEENDSTAAKVKEESLDEEESDVLSINSDRRSVSTEATTDSTDDHHQEELTQIGPTLFFHPDSRLIIQKSTDSTGTSPTLVNLANKSYVQLHRLLFPQHLYLKGDKSSGYHKINWEGNRDTTRKATTTHNIPFSKALVSLMEPLELGTCNDCGKSFVVSSMSSTDIRTLISRHVKSSDQCENFNIRLSRGYIMRDVVNDPIHFVIVDDVSASSSSSSSPSSRAGSDGTLNSLTNTAQGLHVRSTRNSTTAVPLGPLTHELQTFSNKDQNWISSFLKIVKGNLDEIKPPPVRVGYGHPSEQSLSEFIGGDESASLIQLLLTTTRSQIKKSCDDIARFEFMLYPKRLQIRESLSNLVFAIEIIHIAGNTTDSCWELNFSIDGSLTDKKRADQPVRSESIVASELGFSGLCQYLISYRTLITTFISQPGRKCMDANKESLLEVAWKVSCDTGLKRETAMEVVKINLLDQLRWE